MDEVVTHKFCVAEMLYRLALSLSVLSFGSALAHAETPAQLPIPEACAAASAEQLPALEKRRQDLEREVARRTTALEGLAKHKDGKTSADADKRNKELRQTLRVRQEDLLDVLFRIECSRAAKEVAATRAPPSRSPYARLSAKERSALEVTIYYATNRKPTGSTEPAKFYGAEVDGALQYGRALVSVPLTHTPGALELPKLWKLERQSDPNKHFVLKAVAPLDTDVARKEMAEKLAGLGANALLIFVHGYNMGFTEAALRTAQLTYDLKFPGIALLYSWPSANQIRAYWKDEEVARFSEGTFDKLIDDLSQLAATAVYIVAHSMGSRIVGHALQARVEKGKPTKHLREVLLAAPDISAEIFRRDIAPKLAEMLGTRATIYAASGDMALKASRVVHGFKRVGDTAGGVLTFTGIETPPEGSGQAAGAASDGRFSQQLLAAPLKGGCAAIRLEVPATQRWSAWVARRLLPPGAAEEQRQEPTIRFRSRRRRWGAGCFQGRGRDWCGRGWSVPPFRCPWRSALSRERLSAVVLPLARPAERSRTSR
jgi:esterase/lipase superfamily enzyme